MGTFTCAAAWSAFPQLRFNALYGARKVQVHMHERPCARRPCGGNLRRSGSQTRQVPAGAACMHIHGRLGRPGLTSTRRFSKDGVSYRQTRCPRLAGTYRTPARPLATPFAVLQPISCIWHIPKAQVSSGRRFGGRILASVGRRRPARQWIQEAGALCFRYIPQPTTHRLVTTAGCVAAMLRPSSWLPWWQLPAGPAPPRATSSSFAQG